MENQLLAKSIEVLATKHGLYLSDILNVLEVVEERGKVIVDDLSQLLNLGLPLSEFLNREEISKGHVSLVDLQLSLIHLTYSYVSNDDYIWLREMCNITPELLMSFKSIIHKYKLNKQIISN